MTNKTRTNKWEFNIDPKTVKQHINYIAEHLEYLQNRIAAWEKDENDFTIDDVRTFDDILGEIGYLMENAKITIRRSRSGYRIMKEI